MTEALRNVRGELAREVNLVHKLNAQVHWYPDILMYSKFDVFSFLKQLASIQEELVEKEALLVQSNQRVADLEKQSMETKKQLDLIMEGNYLKPLDTTEESQATKVSEATVEALRQRAALAERDVAVLNGIVEAMKRMLAIQWDQKDQGVTSLKDKVELLERNQSVWEAETKAAKDRVRVLERQMQGKDETIAALRAQLLSRK